MLTYLPIILKIILGLMLIALQTDNNTLPIKWFLAINCHFGNIFTKEQVSINCGFKF